MTLEAIRAARERIRPYIRETPFLQFEHLSRRFQKEVWLKCESLQRTGSFKIRGAANCLLENMAQAKKGGVVAASAGNHAQGVAAISHILGIRATIVMPEPTPTIKIHNTSNWGAEVELFGQNFNESFQRAQVIAKEKSSLFVHPYLNPHIMAGQGTVALEMMESPHFDGVEAVVIAVGGGGLITGCATALRAKHPKIKIYGVSAQNAPACWKSFQAGNPVESPVLHTIAEGVATKRTEPEMLSHLKANLDGFFSVNEESIAFAISILAEHAKLLVEGAGALPIAAILNGLIPERKIAVVLSGGNIDLPILSNVLQRGMVEQNRLVRLLIWVPDRPGGLNSVTEILAERRANILEVMHQRMTLNMPFGETEIEIDLETRGKEHTEEILGALTAAGLKVKRLS